MPDRSTCRELPWEDGGCAMMMDLGQGFTCTSATWPCRRMVPEVKRRVVDPDLDQGWEHSKRMGMSKRFRRFSGDESFAE